MPYLRFDSISTFSINADGSLAPVNYAVLTSTGPRAFEFNSKGDKVLVSFFEGSSIAVYGRNVETGVINTENGITFLVPTSSTGKGNVGVNHAIWDYR